MEGWSGGVVDGWRAVCVDGPCVGVNNGGDGRGSMHSHIGQALRTSALH